MSYWNRIVSTRITRRRALATGASGLGSALLVACSGSSGTGTLKLDDASTSRPSVDYSDLGHSQGCSRCPAERRYPVLERVTVYDSTQSEVSSNEATSGST